MKKLYGFAAPYMLGLVIGVGVISTTMANRAMLQKQTNEQKYLEAKQQNIQKLAETLQNVHLTDATNSDTVTQGKLSQYFNTNIFSIDNFTTIKQVGSIAGEKTTVISLDNNRATANTLSAVTEANILKQDLSGKQTAIYSERSLRDRQIIESYKKANELKNKIYAWMDTNKIYRFQTYTIAKQKDAWGRDLTYTRVDANNAEISFTLPWATGTKKVVKMTTPIMAANYATLMVDFNEIYKAYEKFHEDTGQNLPLATSIYTKIDDLIIDPGIAGWAGPYLAYADHPSYTHVFKHPIYQSLYIVHGRDVDGYYQNTCDGSTTCYVWVGVNGFDEPSFNELDTLYDNGDGALHGNIKWGSNHLNVKMKALW